MPRRAYLEIEGRRVAVSNLEKVFYPRNGFTKADVIDYYIRIAPALLPHLKNRPVTLKRYPNGVAGGFFYEKRCPPYRPDWVKTTAVYSRSRRKDIHYCLIDNLPSLIWAVNLADLEIHPFLWRSEDRHQPTSIVFDLDPGAPANILDCVRVALRLRDLLAAWGLTALAKTSGSKGLQVYLPLNTEVHFDRTRQFAKALAQILEKESPKTVVSKMTKSLRRGKVLIDWSQNAQHKTTVSVYSLRANESPTVSMPVEWNELTRALRKKDPKPLSFAPRAALRRVEKFGDRFLPLLTLKQRLPDVL